MKLTEQELQRARKGSTGNLRKSWEAHCVRCERAGLGYGYGGSTGNAASGLRADGWRTRQGFWCCPICIEEDRALARPTERKGT